MAVPILLHDLAFYLSGAGEAGSIAVVDQSVNNHIITLGGNAAISANRSKFYDTSFYVDGVGDYASADGVVAKVWDAPAYTVAGWFYHESFISGENALFGFHTNTGTNEFVVGYRGVFGGSGFTTTYFAPAPLGEWYHMAAVVESGKKAYTLYRNGKVVLAGTWTGTGGNLLATDRFSFGQEWDNNSATDFMHGNIQDLFVYRDALWREEFTPPGPMLGQISGVVVDAAGGAAVGRVVLAVPASYAVNSSYMTTTDALGAYSFPHCLKGVEYCIIVPDDSAKKVDRVKRAKAI